MAPEVMLRQNHSFSADLFAVGVVAYELFVGGRPYAGRDRKSIREEMLAKEAKLTAQNCGRASTNALSFVNGVCRV
jgi:serine/threonine protein kinase